MYKGSYPAIVTPFKADKIDETGLRENINFQIANGSSGVVACATTGESPSLSISEFELVIKIAVEETKNKIPVIAGAGTNSTVKSIELVKRAEKCGAQGFLIVTPYYNKPTQEGLYQHYHEISKSTELPIIIYNVPSRTGCNILPKTVARLAKDNNNIVAIKEASGNLDNVSELQMLLGDNFDILSGDDSLTFPMMVIGAKGVISVAANVLPKPIADMCQLCLAQNFNKAQQIHLKLFPVIKALFIETNPIPVKKAMELMGLPAGKPRLPLVEMTKENTEVLRKALIHFGVDL